VSWTWVNERYRGELPADLASTVMTLDARDRLHGKQGRTTARVVFHPGHDGGGRPAGDGPIGEGPPAPDRPLAVYLKRHYRLPWAARWAALVDPAGRHSPAAAEWTHLERARRLGIEVPEVVAAGEFIGPRGDLRSFLMIAELTGCEPLNEVLPRLAARLDPGAFARLKRRLIVAMARITATLHAARDFHKDLYLCHFFLDVARLDRGADPPRLVLIDLHRLRRHRLWPAWWRWKDLGQLLFSTYGVDGIDAGDRRRFWRSYRRRSPLVLAAWQERFVRLRAARYRRHNRRPR
jgi:heptose I phosphotransferase